MKYQQPKPFIGSFITRNLRLKSALVTIRLYWFEGDDVRSHQLEEWETANRGASKRATIAVKNLRKSCPPEIQQAIIASRSLQLTPAA